MALIKKLSEEELAIFEIIRHPLWCGEFMRSLDEEDDVDEDWEYTSYQREFICDFSSYVSFSCGRSVGKTLSIIDKLVWLCLNTFWKESIVYTVPNKVHLEPVFLRLTSWFRRHPFLKYYTGRTGINSQSFNIKLHNGAVVDCRIAGQSGTGANVVGLHVPILLLDEAGFYPWGTWIELLPTLNSWQPGFQLLVSGVPTGMREKNVLYFVDQKDDEFSKHRVSAHENPRYSEADEVRNIKQFGGTDSEDYIHLVLGEHGAPAYALFDRSRMLIEDYNVFKGTIYGQKIKEDKDYLDRFYVSLPRPPKDTTRIAFGIDLGYCYSADTDVLTKRGWVKHADVTLEDTVACYDTKDDKIIWDKPLDLLETEHNGDMLEVNGKSTNFMVTPGHRVWIRKTPGKKSRDNYEELSADELTTLSNARFNVKIAAKSDPQYGPDYFEVPYYYCNRKDRDIKSTKVPMSLWVQFLAWFISEGSATANRCWEINLTQSADKYADKIDTLLEQLPFTVQRKEFITQWGNKQIAWSITCKALCSWLRENCGVHARNKKVPEFIFNLSTEHQELFLRTLLLGDGVRVNSNRSPAYISTSKKLLDQVQRIAISLGYSSTRSFYTKDDIGRVSIMTRTENQLHRDHNITKVPYNGKVYSLTTSTGYYITRRKGKVAIQGNTEPSVVLVLYQTKESSQWRVLARVTARQVPYPIQEYIIDKLDSLYHPQIIGIDEGSSGKALIQHLFADPAFKHKNYKSRLVPIMFRASIIAGYDEDGEELKVRAKQFGVQLLQTRVNEHSLIFSSKDDTIISELERTTYSKTPSGELVFRTMTARGGFRHAQDHNLAALICFVIALYTKEDLGALTQRRVNLYKPRWSM